MFNSATIQDEFCFGISSLPLLIQILSMVFVRYRFGLSVFLRGKTYKSCDLLELLTRYRCYCSELESGSQDRDPETDL